MGEREEMIVPVGRKQCCALLAHDSSFVIAPTGALMEERNRPIPPDGRYNEKADVHSFAVVMWELVTGWLPFSGLSPDQFMFQVVQVTFCRCFCMTSRTAHYLRRAVNRWTRCLSLSYPCHNSQTNTSILVL